MKLYYKVIGPNPIKNPKRNPDKVWINGMNKWAAGTIVLFMKFTKARTPEYSAWVRVCRRNPQNNVWPKRKLKYLELPYSWLEPQPNFMIDDEWGIGVGPMGLMVIKMR
jgi:hypothetical protein